MATQEERTDTIRLLHVDDQLEFAEMVTTFLERENDRFDTETAATAKDGLACLADSSFDCVLSDYDMPGQDGIEFLKTVRDNYPELPFILYTGKGSEAVASDALSAGATDYLRKEAGTDQFTVLASRLESVVEQTRTQQRQMDAIETAQHGIAILDSDGNHVSVNQAYADIYRTDPDELIGEHWTTLHPENEAEFIRTDIFPSVEEDGYWQGRITGLRTDGTTFPRECAVSTTVKDMIILTVRDISEQIESKKRLSRYNALSKVIQDPVYVLDEEGRFEFVNESFVETFGYEQDELLGNDISMIKDETAVEQGRRNLGRVLSSDGPDSVYFETDIKSQGGKTIPCEDHLTALPYEGEKFNGSAGILRDISERKAREEKLKRQNRRLDEFASVVSHDLRNPLTVAEGNLELLREECESERIDKIDSALTRMDELIEDLLQLARADERMESTKSVNLAEISQSCWQNVETTDATIEIDITTAQSIEADPNRLAQLLENLMRNAIEHADQSEGGDEDVTITLGEIEDGFYLADDGSGIPIDERDDVFEAGYTTSKRGTGFGLSIVEQVVEAHGWNISITESTEGGARFEVTDVKSNQSESR
ncbi:MAG: PAS sensor histidine kinase [Haloquadratum sp. J07HQX50]|nr:MAG: PAS sensor histidine kinase [Haloquadratum sp. J07HQX50]